MDVEIKDMISFTLVSKKIKFLCINLKMYVQDLHEKNYNTVMNEIKE